MTEPIVIVGSRLQSLIYAVSAVALGIGLFDSIGWPVLLLSTALLILSAVVVARRAVLSVDSLELRRITGRVAAPIGTFAAETGHRYLTVSFDDGTSARVEVPVEVRPNVRAWATMVNGARNKTGA